MLIYRTYFKLTNPVIDLNEAIEYLTEEDMTVYLKDDRRIAQHARDEVQSIAWILTDEESGYIELNSNSGLSVDELYSISEWVSGQNSDGLGEGFEQQPFAFYEVDEYGERIDSRYYYDEDELGDTSYVSASFDWQSNEYIFEFVREE